MRSDLHFQTSPPAAVGRVGGGETGAETSKEAAARVEVRDHGGSSRAGSREDVETGEMYPIQDTWGGNPQQNLVMG